MNNKQPKPQELKQEQKQSPKMNNPVQSERKMPNKNAYKQYMDFGIRKEREDPGTKFDKNGRGYFTKLANVKSPKQKENYFDDDYEQEFKDNDFDNNEKDVFDLDEEKHTESDQFKKGQEHNFDENNESEDLSVDENSNNSGEVGDLGHTLDELEDSGIFNVKMVDEEGNVVFDGNSMDAPLWDENGNEYAIDKIDKDELNRSGIIHLKSGSNNKSLELKLQQLEELIPEDKREQTKLLLDYFVNDLGIDEETALDSIIESAKKVKKL